MYFDTIALLRAQSSVPLNTEFIVGGHSIPGDGGGGTFIWIPVPPPTPLPLPDDDGIIIHAPQNFDPGYFQRLFSGPINVRWFGATGDGATDDTAAVHAARDSQSFADNGTLYFPKGKYVGAFIFDYLPGVRNEINIVGDGHGSMLISNVSGNPVVTLGFRFPGWDWARISNLAIVGRNENTQHQPTVNGVVLSNPSDPSLNTIAGRWVFERVSFTQCNYGVFKEYGNIGNHFIDCTFSGNDIGVFAQAVKGEMHAGCDRYSGGQFDSNGTAGIQYLGEAPQIIVDGTIFEYNRGTAWAISIKLLGSSRMTWSAVCIRNAWFEDNGTGSPQAGGDLEFEGVRSVRIDDCRISGRIHVRDSSVNLYNCQLSSDQGGATGDAVVVDDKSSLVAYEHRYESYPTSRIFVNSISYDGSQDIAHMDWQPTSVWGPLRCVKSTRPSVVVSYKFDISNVPFDYIQGPGTGTTYCHPNPMHVLGTRSGKLIMPAAGRIQSNSVKGIIGPYPIPKYIVWSIHTYLESKVPMDELFGEIKSGGTGLGRVYFKHGQWACSYGMKLVDATNKLTMELEFESLHPRFFLNNRLSDHHVR